MSMSCPIMDTIFSERKTVRQVMIIQAWVFHKCLFKNEQSELSLQVKQMTAFVANDKIGTSKQELEFWKAFICHHEYDSFQYPKNFSDENDGGIKESGFLFVIVKCICQYLGDLHNSVNQYFPNDECMML